MTEEDFKNVIDNGSRVIMAMSEELEKMKIKYGTRSQFVKTKEFHLNCLIEMHEEAVNEINNLRNALKSAIIINKAMEIAQNAMVESFAANIHTDQYFLLMPHGKN